MKFKMETWLSFRQRAIAIGWPILACKNPETHQYDDMPREELEQKIFDITALLKQSDAYMDACGLSCS
jgi:hypothetical protein